jgi:hypothetical protein
MSGGISPKRKGARAESHLVAFSQAVGLCAERVPLSRSVGGSFAGDLNIQLFGRDVTVECKVRWRAFNQRNRWLADRDILIVRADRTPLLVVLPWKPAVEIAVAAGRNKGHSSDTINATRNLRASANTPAGDAGNDMKGLSDEQ